jgi:hypothetical protein
MSQTSLLISANLPSTQYTYRCGAYRGLRAGLDGALHLGGGPRRVR